MLSWTEVKNLKWTDTSYTDIDMDVNFSHIGEFVRFTAKADDSEPHGRELHQRAMNGEFGAVSPPEGA